MRILAVYPWRGGMSAGLACLFLAGHVWAQTQVASQSPAQSLVSADIASVTKPASTPATKPHDDGFVIGNGDVLAISVWKQPDLSRSLPVRSDGKISLPLIGEVQATGQTPLKLEEEIATKFQPYLAEPEVTVIVEQINSQKFNILGRVSKAGILSAGQSDHRSGCNRAGRRLSATSPSRNPFTSCADIRTAASLDCRSITRMSSKARTLPRISTCNRTTR